MLDRGIAADAADKDRVCARRFERIGHVADLEGSCSAGCSLAARDRDLAGRDRCITTSLRPDLERTKHLSAKCLVGRSVQVARLPFS
jgi:hypothetical protein